MTCTTYSNAAVLCCADRVGWFRSMVRYTVPWSREGLLDHLIEFVVTHDVVGGWMDGWIGCMTTIL